MPAETASRPPPEYDAPPPERSKPPAKGDDDLQTVRATLKIDPKPGGKRFQGVWLEAAGGGRLLIDYRANEWWRPFEGKLVEARGEPYVPRGQAIMADHFRVHELHIVEPTVDDALISVHAAEDLTGTFTQYSWPKQTKLAGTKATVFVSDDGTQFWLSQKPDPMPQLDTPVRITARRVEPSNFIARPGGPYLWVISAEPVK